MEFQDKVKIILIQETGSNKRLRVDYEGVNDSTKADWNSEEVDAAKVVSLL